METIKKLQLFRKISGSGGGPGFGVKKVIDSLSFLSLLTHIGLNFNEKVVE